MPPPPASRNRKRSSSQRPKSPRAPKRVRRHGRRSDHQPFPHESESLIFLGLVESEPPPVVDLTEQPAMAEAMDVVSPEEGSAVETEMEPAGEQVVSRVEETEPEAGCSGRRSVEIEKEPEADGSQSEAERQPEVGSSAFGRSSCEENFEFYK